MRYLIMLLMCVASPLLIQAQSALFPATRGDVARGVPSLASATCRDDYTSTTGTVYTCKAACPFGSTGERENDGLSALAQPECGCSAEGGNVTAPDRCCKKGSQCTSRLDVNARPVQYVNDASPLTYWQSAPTGSASEQYTANVTIDLLIQQEILEMDVDFEGLVPQAMIVLRSQDGETFSPYQYYAVNCESVFGLPSNPAISDPEQVVCITGQSSARRTSINFQALSTARIDAAQADYATSDALQVFTRARYLRLAFVRFHTLESAKDQFGQITSSVPPLYRVRDVRLSARCSCNGHADTCSVDAMADDGSLACECQHNTEGTNCERCAPLYNRKQWRRGISSARPNVCLRCNCNDHADRCHYDATLDSLPASDTAGDGGVCDGCIHNTEGRFCESCVSNHFRNANVAINHPETCIPCSCNEAGVVGSRVCDIDTGACTCKSRVEGRDCGRCKPGFFGLSADNAEGCEPCVCNSIGTDSTIGACNGTTGQCPCRPSNSGFDCSSCADGFYRPQASPEGQCRACHPECDGCFGEGPEQCIACRHVSDGGVCRPECPAGKYDNNGFCEPCHKSCFGNCTAGGNTLAACNNRCKRFSLRGVCIDECPVGFYVDSETLSCEACDEECIQCYGAGPDQCDLCKGSRDNGVCVAECPQGEYEDGTGNCRACHPQCDQTLSCSGPLSSECDRCENIFDALTRTCRDTCPGQGFYEVQENSETTCRQCNDQCGNTCNGPTAADCIGRCANLRFSGVCVPACPPGTFESPGGTDCLRCNAGCDDRLGCFGPGPHECIECAAGSFSIITNNLTRFSCVAACPVGMYPDAARQCQPCHPECDLCYGPSASQCTHCKNFAYYPASGAPQCRGRCPPEISFEGDLNAVPTQAETSFPTVLTSTGSPTGPGDDCGSGGCEDGSGLNGGSASTVTPSSISTDAAFPTSLAPKLPNEFDPNAGYLYTPRDSRPIDATFACLPCHPECSAQGCNGLSNADCNTCQNVEYLGRCIPACPAFTYRTAEDRCFDCDVQCVEGCTGPGPSNCDTCRGVRFEGVCVPRCPDNAFLTGGECIACAKECSSAIPGCSGPSPFECNACADFQIEETGQCVEICPPGTYPGQDRLCQPCHPLCEQCIGPNTDQCLGCRGVEFDHFCLEECPSGFFRNSEAVCVQCDFECLEDCLGPGPGRCVLLPNSTAPSPCRTLLQDSICVASCSNTKHYLNPNGISCSLCAEACDNTGCSGPSPKDCNACAKASLGNECVLDCPLTHYVDEQNVCRPCDILCTAGPGARRCHGAGPSKCTACTHAQDGATCVSTCKTTQAIVDGLCIDCHPQCQDTCRGPGAEDCTACAEFDYDGVCVATCPDHLTFPIGSTKTCAPCHPECNLLEGIGGCPTGTTARDCRRCAMVIESGVCRSSCSIGLYADKSDTSLADLGSCRPCHPQCSGGCTGPSATQCNTCAQFTYRDTCVSTCPPLTFRSGGFCLDCNHNCLSGCTGAGPEECTPDRLRLETTAQTLGCRDVVDILPNGVTTCYDICPLGMYADADGICTRCSSLCSIAYGCIGPGVDGCIGCPSTQYLDIDRLCQDCHPDCKEGCSGPSEAECDTCRGVRFGDDCLATCHVLDDPDRERYYYADLEVVPGEAVCRSCHPQCAPGGCSGPTAMDCLAGCRAFTDFGLAGATNDSWPICVAECGVNSYTTDTPVARSCFRCALECAGGCSGPDSRQCNACSFARGRLTGECTLVCGLNEVVSPERVCTCPLDRAFVDVSTGECLPCSPECAEGCFGPSASQCHNLPSGCRVAELDGTCVAACPEGMEVRGSECTCMEGFYSLPSGAGCLPCHPQCAGGCSGAGPTRCTRCLNFRSGTTCVETCGASQHPDASRQCAPCATECVSGCTAPGDPTQCGACRNYVDEGRCVNTCPVAKPFSRRTVCLSSCPNTAPYYNDTRAGFAQPLLMPQECVPACEELGIDDRVIVSEFMPFRCTTAALAARDTPPSSASDENDANVIAGSTAGAALGLVVLIVIVIFVVMRRQERRQTQAFEMSASSMGGRVKTNPMYVPKAGRVGSPSMGRINPYMLDVPPGDEDGGYLSVSGRSIQNFEEADVLDYSDTTQSTHI